MITRKHNSQKSLQIFGLFLLFLLSYSTLSYAQSTPLQIQGRVIDSQTNEPILGASIFVKNTNAGVLTDKNGDFQLNTSVGSLLQISYVGYATSEIKVINEKSLLIRLSEKTNNDSFEVIPIGYGQIKKENATSAITTLVPDDFNSGVHLTIQEALLGKLAGVYVYPGSGAPGDGGKIRVRMGASLSATGEPLIVIDGMLVNTSSLSFISPNDVESYTVLKDGAAAIYGSNATNGAILITTKKGLSGDKGLKINYSGNMSVSQVRKYEDVLSHDEFVEAYTKYKNPSNSFKLGTASTDWQKEIYRVALGTDHHISATGGIKNLPYRVSLGYANRNGIVKNSDYECFNTSVSLSPNFFKNHLSVALNVKASRENANLITDDVVRNATIFAPTEPVHANYPNDIGLGYYMWLDKNGNLFSPFNPVSIIDLIDRQRKTTRSVGNLLLNYKIHGFEDLKLNVNIGYDYLKNQLNEDIPDKAPSSFFNHFATWSGSSRVLNDKIKSFRHDYYVQYDKQIGAHSISAMAGYGKQRYWKTFSTDGYTNHMQPVDEGKKQISYKYMHSKNYESHYVARLNYAYASKFFISTTLNADKYNSLLKDNKRLYLPSVSLGYFLSEENFMKQFYTLSALKLRASYAMTVSQYINPSFGYSDFDRLNQVWYPSLGLKDERTTTYNFGVDFGLFKDRISGRVDFYTRRTTNLMERYLLRVYPVTDSYIMLGNIGNMKNKGAEISLNAVPIKTTDLEWSVGGNFTWNTSKMTKVNTPSKRLYPQEYKGSMNIVIHEEGYTPYSYLLLRQAYDETGKPLPGQCLTKDGEVILREDLEHLQTINKSAFAPYYYGISTQLKYKNWDFGLNAHGAFGHYIYNDKAALTTKSDLHTWSAPTNILKKNLDTELTNNDYLSDYYLEKGDFFKLDNITVGYTFAQLWNRQSSLRLAFSARNLFVISKYSGVDPEIYSGIDSYSYPRPRIYALNFSFNF